MMIQDARTTKKLAKDTFEAWAETYDHSLLNYFLFRPSYYTFLEEIARWRADLDGPFNILDIGCGTGTFPGMIALSNLDARHIVGLDYAMEMCHQAARKLQRFDPDHLVSFVNGDSEHLPFPDAMFDVVTCANSFHHYPHQQVVVSEMRRLIRPGGRLMIIDGFRDNAIGWVVFDVVIAAIEKSVHHAPWTTMRSYFEKAGFSEIYHRKFNFLFPAFITVGSVPADDG